MADYPSSGGGPETDPVAGPAVDVERARAQAAEQLKQDAATAATDAELALEQARATAAEALKQDAATAATDAELAAAVSALQAADTALGGQVTAETSARQAAVTQEATDRAAADALLVPLAQKNAANGVAALDANSRLTKNAPFAYGTLSNQPSAAAVPDGFPYFATDDNGGTLYQARGGAWAKVAPRGTELQRATAISNKVVDGTTPVDGNGYSDWTGLALTAAAGKAVVVTDRPVRVEAGFPYAFNSTALNGTKVAIFNITSNIFYEVLLTSATANARVPGPLMRMWLDTPGTYELKVQVGRQIGGTATAVAGAAQGPAFITATEV